MEKVLQYSPAMMKHYFMLTKPGIIFGNVVTAAGGFALASRHHLSASLFLFMLLGLGLIIASACVFNNCIDIDLDKKMQRTKNRSLVTGDISVKNALSFASMLGLLGIFVLSAFVNFLTTAVAFFGFFMYVTVYSFLKYRSVHGTLIGSIAGAVPPVAGYCAVTNQLDLCALILFLMIAMWQMPHFFAIAIYRLEDYAAASIPVLPIKRGMLATKIQMLFYTVAFVCSCLMLTIMGYTGRSYFVVVALLGITWLALSISGFKAKNDKVWARKMFIFSLIFVMSISGMMGF
jgi:protoheme IX farnesyltransferase